MARALILDRGEGLLAARYENADKIDDRVGTLRGGSKRIREAHIGLDRVDLTHVAERLQMSGKLWPPHGNPHPRAGLGQRPHDMPAEKAGPAIEGDE